jgi:hypothetical protein
MQRRFTTKAQRTQRKHKEEKRVQGEEAQDYACCLDLFHSLFFFVLPLCSLCLCGESSSQAAQGNWRLAPQTFSAAPPSKTTPSNKHKPTSSGSTPLLKNFCHSPGKTRQHTPAGAAPQAMTSINGRRQS